VVLPVLPAGRAHAVKAIIVGGGIGGLATAAALRRAGHEPVVLERATALAEIGAGLSMAPNALAALHFLGIGDELRRRGAIARRILVRNPQGDVLSEIDVNSRAWEVVGVHRADLQDVLVRAAAGSDIHLGLTCTGFAESTGAVAAVTEDGSEIEGDVLIGADGIRSVVRSQLRGEEPLRYAGYFGWRAVVDFDDPSIRDTFSESWGPVLRVGLVTIGHGRLYWFVSELAPEDTPLPDEPEAHFRDRLGDWHDPIPAVAATTPPGTLTRLPIHDRPPAKEWGRGRVTLIGDAAHPMTPNLGQGAAQALEDAVALAEALTTGGDPVESLRDYERRRIPRTAMIVKRSRQLGRVAHLRSPLACRVRDAVTKATPERVQRRQQELVIRPGL
jgi:2-polyprenyl-6-methoxyphenol hydroxylase-like FAD-dependent oxidoreductase